MSELFDFSKPRPIISKDRVLGFNCGVDVLNQFLQKYALQAQQSGGARTYVSFSKDGTVAGFFSLAFSAVEYEKASMRLSKGMARHPIPVVLLARLAVDQRYKGQGLGKELLRDAMLRTLHAAEIAGLRALIVDAKDKAGSSFYRRFGFQPFRDQPQRLSLMLKDIKAQIK
jgi:GNAT superfamily N-acetyltransferase